MGFLKVQGNAMSLNSQERKRKFSAVDQLKDLASELTHHGDLHGIFVVSDLGSQYLTVPCESRPLSKWYVTASHFDNLKNQKLDADKVRFSFLLLLL